MSTWPYAVSMTAVCLPFFPFLDRIFYYCYPIAIMPFVLCVYLCLCVCEREHTCYSGLSITFFLVHRTLDQEMPHPDLHKNKNFTEPEVLDFELVAVTRWEFLWGGVSVLCV